MRSRAYPVFHISGKIITSGRSADSTAFSSISAALTKFNSVSPKETSICNTLTRSDCVIINHSFASLEIHVTLFFKGTKETELEIMIKIKAAERLQNLPQQF